MLRLNGYTSSTLAVGQPSEKAPALLSCLLQAGQLETHQRLAVWVGGVNVPLTQEEGSGQVVCTWQCQQEIEMEIRLLQYHSQIKAWRGWWRDGKLVHVGTLPVQVFLDERVQSSEERPSALAGAEGPLVAVNSLDHRNGTSVLHSSSTTLLERTEASLTLPVPERTSSEEVGDLWEMDLHRWLEGATAAEQELQVLEELGEAMEESQPAPLATGEEQVENVNTVAPGVTGPLIAALAVRPPISLTQQGEMLQQLTELLEQMPPNTILVDLRQHAPTVRPHGSRRSSPRTGMGWGLSKELLRAQYGARYWTRDSIKTTSRRISTHPTRWVQEITNPNAPELQELLAHLSQGVSVLLLEREEPYEGSKRKAVVNFVRSRCPQVTMGTCS